jgi:predicted metal-binding membrane protein
MAGLETRSTSGGARHRAPVLLGAGLAVLVSWGALLVMLGGSPSTASSWQSSQWWCMPGMPGAHPAAPGGQALAAGLGMWLAMSVAMMVPATLPTARRLAGLGASALARAVFFAAYLAVWLVFGALSLELHGELGDSRFALPAIVVIAAAWQLTPYKRRALAHSRRRPESGRSTPGLPMLARFGLVAGSACVASCWAMMLAMSVAVAGQLLWALGITAAACCERLLPHPRLVRRATAVALLGVALVVAFGV